jgi:predicted dehydrogenase
MKIALLGTGFGQAHAAVYAASQGVEVVMFGRNPDKTATVASKSGLPPAPTSTRRLRTARSIWLISACPSGSTPTMCCARWRRASML